ncbi:unnamed protein product, partial [Pocillopora meandrina]
IYCWIVLLTLPYFNSRLDIFHSEFWAFRDGPLDDLLEGLNDRLKTTVLSSKANGTFIVYNRAFCGWNQFANDKLNGKAFLASSFHNLFRPLLIHDIKKSDLDIPVKLRNFSMYVLSFASFFRFDDVSRIRRRKGSCKLVAPDKPISYSTIRGAFRWDLQSLGVEPSKLGLHSLRSTMIANNGVNDI